MIRWLIPLAALAAINWLVVQPAWLHTAHHTQVVQVGGIIVMALLLRFAVSAIGREEW